jgi:hypothetical protein
VFCEAPLDREGSPLDLLPYLAKRLPTAKVSRGWLGYGPVQEVRVVVNASEFRARKRRDRLELFPDLAPSFWVEELTKQLTLAAEHDLEVRSTLSRTGWAWRRTEA